MMTVNSSSWLGDYIYSMLMFHHISECHERHHEGYTHGQASGHGIVNYVGSSQHRDSPFKFSASAVLPFKLWHRPPGHRALHTASAACSATCQWCSSLRL